MTRFLGVIRAPFLLLTPVCVALGAATAADAAPAWPVLLLAAVAALSAHVSVNALNEYADFKSGLDLETRRTPFSGGSGVLAACPRFAGPTLATGLAALAVSVGSGLYLVSVAGWQLLPLGLLGAVLVVAYTPWLNRNALLCFLAPGLGFGPVMVMGTHYALTGSYAADALAVSLVTMLLVSNLLLLNQFPDTEADRRHGRSHLPIRIGRTASAAVFAGGWLLAYVILLAGRAGGVLPGGVMIALIPLPLVLVMLRRVWNTAADTEGLVPWMGVNVALVLATPLLISVGLLI